MHTRTHHRLLSVVAVLALGFFSFLTPHPAFADDGDTGNISVGGGVLSVDSMLNYVRGPADSNGGYVGYWGGFAANMFGAEAQIPIEVTNAAGERVASGYTDHYNKITFTNLPVGTYTVTIDKTWMEDNHEVLYRTIPNDVNKEITAQDYSMTVTVVKGQTAKANFWRFYDPQPFITATDIGTFADYANTWFASVNPKEKIYYRGGSSELYGNSTWYTTFMGVPYNTSAQTYPGMNTLEEPTLSDEEKAKGYTFVGWQRIPYENITVTPASKMNHVLRGTDSYSVAYDYGEGAGPVLSTEQALAVVANGPLVFKAVFERPDHKVVFATDRDKGKVDGGVAVVNIVDHAETVPSIPTVEAAEDWEFVGWYVDNTTNVVANDDITGTPVTQDIVYYAKYKSTKPDPTDGKDGEKGDKGDKGDPGKDGADGKDGVSPTVTIDEAGDKITITITDKDGEHTATVAKGASVTDSGKGLVKAEFDRDYNLTLTLEDGTKLTANGGGCNRCAAGTGNSASGRSVGTLSNTGAAIGGVAVIALVLVGAGVALRLRKNKR